MKNDNNQQGKPTRVLSAKEFWDKLAEIHGYKRLKIIPAKEYWGRKSDELLLKNEGKRQKLHEILKKNISHGNIILSSGKLSSYYVDSKLTTFDAEGISLIGKIVFEIIKKKKPCVTAIGGLTMGADPIAISTIIAALANSVSLKAFSVRKEPKTYGKKKLIEGNLETSDNVVILDDVITTGSSTIKAIDAVREFGANIVMVVALVDRCEGGTEKIRSMGYDVQALFNVDELLDYSKIIEAQENGTNSKFERIAESGILQAELA